ncbi:hypothetical protein B0813_000697 [Candidatus Fervidibacteria bacterium JGI MDM2 SSWTFF-3-K9]
MRCKGVAQIWWTLASFAVIVVATAAPAISPLSIIREKECKDKIDPDLCVYQRKVRTLCCLSQMLFDCKLVEEWKHKTDGTYHYRNPTDCHNLEIACSPYNNHCD